MANRDNCIILIIDPPVPDNTDAELRRSLGTERAVHINHDLLSNAYKKAKAYKGAITILSYARGVKNPDLTWLDADDPGFLESKEPAQEKRALNALELAFFTGAKKAVLLSHLSPTVKPEWLDQAFAAINDRTVVLGPNSDGSIYLAGFTQNNFKTLEGLSFTAYKLVEELTEKAKKNKLNVTVLPESYAVRDEESLRKWVESKEVSPTLFDKHQPPAEPAVADDKKPHKRAHRNIHSPAEPRPESPVERPPQA